jgi:hypothetical protein
VDRSSWTKKSREKREGDGKKKEKKERNDEMGRGEKVLSALHEDCCLVDPSREFGCHASPLGVVFQG